MKAVSDYVVPWVREAEAYSDRHMEFAWSHPEVIRLMSNENPLPPSPAVLDAVQTAARLGNLYPDSGPGLREKLAEAAGLSADNVVLGNGSTDIINTVIETFVAPGDEVIIPVPTFPMYATRTRVNGGVPILVALRPDFSWDVAAIRAAVSERSKLLFIATPNNPTGKEIDEASLLALLELGLPTFIDEAYFELTQIGRTYAGLVESTPHAIVNRTFSKAFGLAGLRVGYCFASRTVAGFLNRKKISWNVSLLAQAAALAALEDQAGLQQRRALIAQERERLCSAVNQVPGLRAFPSEGNFVLIDASSLGRTAIEIVDDLIARGVFVRPMAGHHLDGFIRVTVGSPEQNDCFMECLHACVTRFTQKG